LSLDCDPHGTISFKIGGDNDKLKNLTIHAEQIQGSIIKQCPVSNTTNGHSTQVTIKGCKKVQ